MKYIVIVICILTSLSCINNQQKKKTNIPYVSYSEGYDIESATINVPFTEENGVKMVTAHINGASIDMIFDTGCSQTLISLLEAQILVKRGLLSENDYMGTSKSTIADGSVVEDMVFNLKELKLTDGKQTIVCKDVVAQVSSNIEAPVLLGNGVLDRVASYEIDNENKVIKFKLK